MSANLTAGERLASGTPKSALVARKLITQPESRDVSPAKTLPPLQAHLFYPTRRVGGGDRRGSPNSNLNKTVQDLGSHNVSSSLRTKSLNTSAAVSPQKSRVRELSKEIAMISEFKKTNNPFAQGFTRSDKVRYAGTSLYEPHKRLFEFCTISSLNQSQIGTNVNQQSRLGGSTKVKGVHDLRATFHSNRLMQQIVDEEQFIRTNPKLVTNIESLWKMNLLNEKSIHAMQLPKNHSISYVYNDYHSRSTNPGYARNDKSGTFFTR